MEDMAVSEDTASEVTAALGDMASEDLVVSEDPASEFMVASED